jgi:hypothetical protein
LAEGTDSWEYYGDLNDLHILCTTIRLLFETIYFPIIVLISAYSGTTRAINGSLKPSSQEVLGSLLSGIRAYLHVLGVSLRPCGSIAKVHWFEV